MSDTKLTPYYVSIAVLLVVSMGLIVSSLYVKQPKTFFGLGMLIVLAALGTSIAAYVKAEHYWAPPLEGAGMFLGLADPGQMAACNAVQLATKQAGCPTCTEAAEICLRYPGGEQCKEKIDECECANKSVKNIMDNCIVGKTPQYL